MKKLVAFTIVVISVLFFIGCGSEGSKPTVTTLPAKNESPTPTPTPAKVFRTVTDIGISKLQTTLTAFPNCDGSECYDVEFFVAFKFDDGTKKQLNIAYTGYGDKSGVAKNHEDVKKGLELYKTLSSIDKSKLIVTILGDDIIEISSSEEWEGKNFTPETSLWQYKKY